MEFLEGYDLDEVVQVRGPLPVREALGYVVDVCKAMEEAHDAGIVHRDLKPKNLFLTRRPDRSPLVKVLDFGISKLSEGADDFHTTSTRTGAVLGSPAFMSPEQIKSAKTVDARADIYAIGGIIYFLLARGFPFDASSIGELFGNILYKEPRLLRAGRPDAPVEVEAIVCRCLQKDPDARYPNIRELLNDIRAVLEPAQPRSAPISSMDTLVESPVVADTLVSPTESNRAAGSQSHGAPAQNTLGHASVSSQAPRSKKVSKVPIFALGGLALIATLASVTVGASLLRRQPAVTAAPASADVPPAQAAASQTASGTKAPTGTIVSESSPPAATVQASTDAGAAATERNSASSRPDAGTRKSRPPAAPAPSLRHGALYDDDPASSPNR